MARPLVRDDEGLSTFWSFVGVLVLVIATLAVIQGFDVGVQGLAVGDAKTIVVPPNLGYGPSDPTKILVKPLLEPVPVRVTMNESGFTNTYKTQPVSGANVTDPFWGWSAYVSVSGSIVTVTNSPVPGQTVHPYGGWAARVDSVDDSADNGTGRIVVHHLLDTSAVDRVGQKTASGTVVFVVTAVDLTAGTYTVNYNNPVKGRNLVFEVTMVAIARVG